MIQKPAIRDAGYGNITWKANQNIKRDLQQTENDTESNMGQKCLQQNNKPALNMLQ